METFDFLDMVNESITFEINEKLFISETLFGNQLNIYCIYIQQNIINNI